MTKEELKSVATNATKFRHACKIFDANKKVSDDDFEFLMQSVRLSPSSFGMEAWRFLVIQDQDLRAKLKPVCWGQNQIDTSSHLIAFVAKKGEILKPQSPWISNNFERRGITGDAQKAYIERYGGFLNALSNIDEWSQRQVYIALSTLMHFAALIGIDSCAIEGFSKPDVEKILDIDTSKEQIPVLCAIGYRVNEPREKIRFSKEEVIQTI